MNLDFDGTALPGAASLDRPPGFGALAMAHFRRPCRVGRWTPDAPGVGTGWAGDPTLGDLLRLQIQVSENLIVDARFKAFGSAWMIAVGSFVAEQVVGRSVEQADAMVDGEIVSALALPPLKIRTAVLAVAACRAAVANFRTQNPPDVVQG